MSRRPVRTNPFADEEIFRYVLEYGEKSTVLAGRLWNDIQAAFLRLSEYPEIGEIVPRARLRKRARRIPLRHFPFFLIYRLNDDFIEVMALAHMSRNPFYWRSRFN